MTSGKFPISLHDATFLKLNLKVDARRVVQDIELSFVDESNRYIDVFLQDILTFEISDIIYQNVIFDAEVYSGTDQIRQFFRDEKKDIKLNGLEKDFYEMTVLSSSIGMNGFFIYKSKKVQV